MNPEFWKDKKVFVTGHTGFKGVWLTLWLHSMGAKLRGFALEPKSSPNLFDITNAENLLDSVIGDIRDYATVEQAVVDFQPDIIIHMAAQALVRYSYTHPVETYEVNVMGSVHILEAAKKAGSLKAILNVTSDKCYENLEHTRGYKETEPMGGFDPYSSSKGAAELVTSAYRNSFFSPQKYDDHGVSVASARAGNVIGGGDWAQDRLIPDIVRAFEKKKAVEIRSPNAVRPWQHVLEPLHGYLCLIEKMFENGSDFAEAWNFGPLESDTCSVGEVVAKLVQNWGDGAQWSAPLDKMPDSKLHEASFLYLDSTKARQRLDWKPYLTFDQTLENIVKWYQAYSCQEDMYVHTMDEIKSFEKRLQR